MKTAAIIQARMASTRLPGKVLFPLGATTVLGQLVDRLSLSEQLTGIVVAIPDTPKDEVLVHACRALRVHCFQGDENDLLNRFFEAATKFEIKTIVRITADCPFFDPFLMDEMLVEFARWNQSGVSTDYYTNCTLRRTFPRGLDAEIFTRDALEKTHLEAKQPHEREHVTPYIYTHPDRFRLRSRECATDMSEHRWVLDTDADWRFILKVNEALAKPDGIFTTDEIQEYLQTEPGLKRINADVKQKHADNRFHGAGSK